MSLHWKGIFNVGIEWRVPLDYGDNSGLTTDEFAQLEQWLEQFGSDFPIVFNWLNPDETNFVIDDISGLANDCVKVAVFSIINNPPMTQAQYIKKIGRNCPHCQSARIDSLGDIINDNSGKSPLDAFQELRCNDCNSTWSDVFVLTRYDSLKTPTDK